MEIGDSKLTLGVPRVQVVVRLSAKRLCHPSCPKERRFILLDVSSRLFDLSFVHVETHERTQPPASF